MDDIETQRFDIEQVEYDKEGIPAIPRIGFTIPKAYRKEFLQDMLDEVRTTPGEQLMAIFVKYYRMRRAEATAATKEGSVVPEKGRIPVYGPKPSKLEVGRDRSQIGDEV